MGYGNNHYNYQIAVIFAILIGAVLLLGLVFVGIYLVTKAMRGDDESKKRQPLSGRNSAQWPSQAPSYRPPSQQQQNQSFDFPPRTPVVAPSPAMNIQTSYTHSPAFNPPPQQYNQQYSQVPLVTPTNQDYLQQTRTTQLQPDVIYTQGPSGFMSETPVQYTTYHQSSV